MARLTTRRWRKRTPPALVRDEAISRPASAGEELNGHAGI